MGLFSKSKEFKSGFWTENFDEKVPSALIKRTVVLGAISDPSEVRAVFSAITFATSQNYAICTDTDLVYMTTGGMAFKASKYSLRTITSVSREASTTFTNSIFFSIGGAGEIKLDIPAAQPDVEAFYSFLSSAINKCGIAPAPVPTASAADEIKKFKDLLDDGIITEEEFSIKKKQLLGL